MEFDGPFVGMNTGVKKLIINPHKTANKETDDKKK